VAAHQHEKLAAAAKSVALKWLIMASSKYLKINLAWRQAAAKQPRNGSSAATAQ
jgi:hypothetical protein